MPDQGLRTWLRAGGSLREREGGRRTNGTTVCWKWCDESCSVGATDVGWSGWWVGGEGEEEVEEEEHGVGVQGKEVHVIQGPVSRSRPFGMAFVVPHRWSIPPRLWGLALAQKRLGLTRSRLSL